MEPIKSEEKFSIPEVSIVTTSPLILIKSNWIIDSYRSKNDLESFEFRLDPVPNIKSRLLELLSDYKLIRFLSEEFAGILEFENTLLSYKDWSESTSISIIGSYKEASEIKNIIDKNFKSNRCNIRWFYTKVDFIEVKVNDNELGTFEMYPVLQEKGYNSLDEYFDDYLNSNENLLLLYGDPGLGKSTFIKTFLNYVGKDSIITYDEEILKSDYIFGEFLSNKDVSSFVIEDADDLISSRDSIKSKSSIIQKFLNVGSGIISNSKKKLILSTNLTDISKIDPALIRPGRCFDVLNFTRLNMDQALKLNPKLTLDQADYSLAEIFNNKSISNSRKSYKSKIGFK
jgi:hypothetical protein